MKKKLDKSVPYSDNCHSHNISVNKGNSVVTKIQIFSEKRSIFLLILVTALKEYIVISFTQISIAKTL